MSRIGQAPGAPERETIADRSSPAFCSSCRREARSSRLGLVSVVIPVRNGAVMLAAQLEALSAQTYRGPWEIIVADNGSTDDTVAVASSFVEKVPGLRVIDASGRPGAGYARNAGAAEAVGDFLAFCDADDIVDHSWVEAMAAAARTCDFVGGALETRALSGPSSFWQASAIAQGLATGGWEFLPFATSANFGIRTHLFRVLGGSDERFVSGEDVEFSWRAQLAGHPLCFAPQAVVHYRFRSGHRAVIRQSFRYGTYAPLLYREFRHAGLRRHLSRGLLRWGWLAIHAYECLGGRDRRARWLWRAANALGRIRGSVRHRVVVL